MKKLQLGELTLFGLSKAGFHTGMVLQEPRLAFDLGVMHPILMGCNDVFISHTHTDHIGQIFNYLSQRALLGCDVATFYVPLGVGPDLLALLQHWARFSHTPLDFRVFELAPGTPALLRNQVRVTPFALHHKGPTQGYLVERISRKLKPQYLQLPSGDIQRLREDDPDLIFRTEATPLFAYVPDTLSSALPLLPEAVWKANVLAMECTWIHAVPDVRRVQHAHIMLDELASQLDRFEGRHLVLFHFSAAHKPDEILQRLHQTLPPALLAKTVPLLDHD